MNTETIFKKIYESNYWGGTESISGPGSDLRQTAVIRTYLPILLEKYGVNTILDLPCGDFHWMRHIDLHNVHYIGADIVYDLVNKNTKFSSEKIEFKHLDIIKDNLPKVDLIFSRDCFVHLSFKDIFSALSNIEKSGIKYLLTTTFVKFHENFDIETGEWRPINLEKSPFNFPKPLEILNEQCSQHDGKYSDKSLALWLVKDLYQILKEWRSKINLVLFGDGQGWIVDKIIKRLADDFSKHCNVSVYGYTKISPDSFVRICNSNDVIYYGNWDIANFVCVLDQIKKPLIISIRSFRYPNYVLDIAPRMAGIHIINSDLIEDFPRARYIPDGISDKYFNREFVVGFSAQATPGNLDYKGYFLVKQVCKDLGVKFLPALGDVSSERMPQYYKSLDLFVCASENEGFGAPIIECMAMDVPVVSTRVGIARDLPGITLVDRDVSSIKAAILMHKKKKEKIKRTLIPYSWPVIAEKLLSFIISVHSDYSSGDVA